MPIAICGKCRLPVADAIHYFDKVCECISITEQKKRAKIKGWEINFPKEVEKDD